MDDVHRSAAALLHRVADGGEIPIEVLHGFADLVLHSELVAGARAVLDGPPEVAVKLASVVLAVGVGVESAQEKEVTK
jgi:hypothetical protein